MATPSSTTAPATEPLTVGASLVPVMVTVTSWVTVAPKLSVAVVVKTSVVVCPAASDWAAAVFSV